MKYLIWWGHTDTRYNSALYGGPTRRDVFTALVDGNEAPIGLTSVGPDAERDLQHPTCIGLIDVAAAPRHRTVDDGINDVIIDVTRDELSAAGLPVSDGYVPFGYYTQTEQYDGMFNGGLQTRRLE